MNANPVYASGNTPYGSIRVNVYSTQAAPVLVGVYLLESFEPTDNAVMIKRPNEVGGDGGWAIDDSGEKAGSFTAQRAVNVTPHLQNGWFFKTSQCNVDAGGTPQPEIYVISNVSTGVDAGYRKQTGTATKDKDPTTSAALLAACEEYVA